MSFKHKLDSGCLGARRSPCKKDLCSALVCQSGCNEEKQESRSFEWGPLTWDRMGLECKEEINLGTCRSLEKMELGWGRMLRIGAEFDRTILQREKEMRMVRIDRK